jgi:hypothetical protein
MTRCGSSNDYVRAYGQMKQLIHRYSIFRIAACLALSKARSSTHCALTRSGTLADPHSCLQTRGTSERQARYIDGEQSFTLAKLHALALSLRVPRSASRAPRVRQPTIGHLSPHRHAGNVHIAGVSTYVLVQMILQLARLYRCMTVAGV